MSRDRHHNDGGENPGRRGDMERFTRRLVEAGNDPQYAKRKALEAARRADRREDRKD